MGFVDGIAAGDAPLGQRTREAFRRAPLILWTPLTPDEKGASRPFQTPKKKSKRKNASASLYAFFEFLRFGVAARRPQADSSKCSFPERPFP